MRNQHEILPAANALLKDRRLWKDMYKNLPELEMNEQLYDGTRQTVYFMYWEDSFYFGFGRKLRDDVPRKPLNNKLVGLVINLPDPARYSEYNTFRFAVREVVHDAVKKALGENSD